MMTREKLNVNFDISRDYTSLVVVFPELKGRNLLRKLRLNGWEKVIETFNFVKGYMDKQRIPLFEEMTQKFIDKYDDEIKNEIKKRIIVKTKNIDSIKSVPISKYRRGFFNDD
jgi:hypothetical protein